MLDSNTGWMNPKLPKKGWKLVSVADYGEPVMECTMCGYSAVRYVHWVAHPALKDEDVIGVGCVCCGKMIEDLAAAKRAETDVKNLMRRRNNIVNRNWRYSRRGNLVLKIDGFIAGVRYDDGIDRYKCFVMSPFTTLMRFGTKLHATKEDAMRAAFDAVQYMLKGV